MLRAVCSPARDGRTQRVKLEDFGFARNHTNKAIKGIGIPAYMVRAHSKCIITFLGGNKNCLLPGLQHWTATTAGNEEDTVDHAAKPDLRAVDIYLTCRPQSRGQACRVLHVILTLRSVNDE